MGLFAKYIFFTFTFQTVTMKKIFLITLLAWSGTPFAQNLVVNGNFDKLAKDVGNPKGYCHKPGTTDWADVTPADRWSGWINNPTQNSCMITEVVNIKNTCGFTATIDKSGVEGNVMHIISTIGHSGIAQNPLPANKGVRVSCWVYVVRGGMTIGVINSANNNYQKTAASTTTCKWERLSFTYENPIDNVTIYSKWSSTQPAADGAEFYIDNIVIEKL
jgi:hypothetical protein